jgi:hypothetical protein
MSASFPSDPFALYPLNQIQNGAVEDVTGNNAPAPVNGAKEINTSISPGGLEFDGNDVVDLPDTLVKEDEDHSASIFFRTPDSDVEQFFLSFRGTVILQVSTTFNGSNGFVPQGNLSFFDTNKYNDLGPVPDNEFVHLAYSYDDAKEEWRYIVDGNLVLVRNQKLNPKDQGRSAALGDFQASGGLPFTGTLDEFRVYDRVLSDAEMRALFNNPTGGGQTAVESGSATLSGSADMAPAGTRVKTAAAALEGRADQTAAGTRIRTAASRLSGAGDIRPAATRVKTAAAALEGSADQTAAGTRVRTAASQLSGVGDVSATGTVIIGEEIIRLAEQSIIRDIEADTQTISRDIDAAPQTITRRVEEDNTDLDL